MGRLVNTIQGYHKQLQTKQVTVVDLVNDVLENVTKFGVQDAVVSDLAAEAFKQAAALDNAKIDSKNPLYGIPYAAKDNFNILGTKTTASSNILKNYVSPYNASVITILNEAEAVPVLKATLDELGMGGNGLCANTGYVHNPWDRTRICGGSSSGPAVLVASGVVAFALGTDTGDSVRKPASYCGIVGWKPTYGVISRAGVIPYAPSLDTIGVMTRSVEDAAILTNALIKYDNTDFTSVRLRRSNDYVNDLNPDVKGKNWCYIKAVHDTLPLFVQKKYTDIFNDLRKQGAIIDEIDFPLHLLRAVSPIYNVISYSESISTHSNLSGINFGDRKQGDNYKEIMINSRSEGLGREVIKRFIIGAHCLKNQNQKLLFYKAKQVRNLIAEACDEIYDKYDGLFTPAASGVAPLISTVANQKQLVKDANDIADCALVMANLNGSPSLSIPVGFHDKLPFGICLSSKLFAESAVLSMGLAVENITGYKNLWVGAGINEK